MPTIKYSNNPNSDTAFVVQDGGQKNRAVLTAEPAGTLQLSDSANVSTGYVTDEDGKKHKVNLVAQLEGEVEFSENPNSTKGYVTVDSKKHRVVLTASLHGGGSAPVIEELNVTPSTSAQTITAPEGTDGYSPVNVSAVTSSIDANISAGNIKKDVTVLGVTGSYEGVAPSGTKPITTNGVHDVSGYASADVQVPTTAPEIYRVFRVNNGKIENSISTPFIPLPSTATDISDNCYYKAYYYTPASVLSGAIDLSSLTTISGSSACYYMFTYCYGITSVDLSSLTTLSGQNACAYMFMACSGITSVDLSSLTTISGQQVCSNMFYDCTALTSVDLSSLTTISGRLGCSNMFYDCTALTSVDLSSLTTISGSSACQFMFYGCTSLTTVYIGGTTAIDFGTQTNQFGSMFSGCTQNIDVYAPAVNQTQIEAFSGYPNFGATGTVTWHWRS